LAIVAKITQLHGGSIEVTERAGGGSVFQLLLGQSPESKSD
jgi:signal transduction histidine kinase